MSAFEDFITVELPKRPFTTTDGTVGQIQIRSNNAGHPLEMEWADIPGIVVPTTYTAAENLSGHRMVLLSDTYEATYADNQTLGHAHRVLGMTSGAVALGDQATVVREQELQEPSWTWTVGGAIYLGAGGTLVQSAPVSPALFSLCVGFATAADRMFISVGMPIILS